VTACNVNSELVEPNDVRHPVRFTYAQLSVINRQPQPQSQLHVSP